jgi:hypothetical protein
VFVRQCNVRFYSENSSVLDKFNIMRTLRPAPNRTTIILFVTDLILLCSILMKTRPKTVVHIIFYDFLEICFHKLFVITTPPPTIYDIFFEKRYLFHSAQWKNMIILYFTRDIIDILESTWIIINSRFLDYSKIILDIILGIRWWFE